MMIGNGGGSRANRINVTHLLIYVNGNGDVVGDRIIEVNIIVHGTTRCVKGLSRCRLYLISLLDSHCRRYSGLSQGGGLGYSSMIARGDLTRVKDLNRGRG